MCTCWVIRFTDMALKDKQECSPFFYPFTFTRKAIKTLRTFSVLFKSVTFTLMTQVVDTEHEASPTLSLNYSGCGCINGILNCLVDMQMRRGEHWGPRYASPKVN